MARFQEKRSSRFAFYPNRAAISVVWCVYVLCVQVHVPAEDKRRLRVSLSFWFFIQQ